MVKKVLLFALSVVTTLVVSPKALASSKPTFYDVHDKSWYVDDVRYVYAAGLMGGGSGVFSPNKYTDRAMVVSILHRMEGSPAIEQSEIFEDVKENKYYFNAINWAVSCGIASGYESGKFSPNDQITREGLAEMMYKYAEYRGIDTTTKADLSVFGDFNAVHVDRVDAMAWANADGLISGTNSNILDPKGLATRAQVAAIIHRFSENKLGIVIASDESLFVPSTIKLPAERVVTGTDKANAPSNGGWEGVSQIDLIAYLTELSNMPYYDSTRAARYLNYYGSRYTGEQIIRIVNTNNDLVPYYNTTPTNTAYGNLMLVNKYHFLDRSYAPSHTVALGKYGSKGTLPWEVYEAFKSMADDATKAGLPIWSNSSYRSFSNQNSLYYGYVRKSGIAGADIYSARAGHSEHQTGLAVDIGAKGGTFSVFEYTPQCKWVMEHAHEYGFILRYGYNMNYITCYMYEPWHYRYVGKDAAKFIYENNLTFEEYYYYYVCPGHVIL